MSPALKVSAVGKRLLQRLLVAALLVWVVAVVRQKKKVQTALDDFLKDIYTEFFRFSIFGTTVCTSKYPLLNICYFVHFFFLLSWAVKYAYFLFGAVILLMLEVCWECCHLLQCENSLCAQWHHAKLWCFVVEASERESVCLLLRVPAGVLNCSVPGMASAWFHWV